MMKSVIGAVFLFIASLFLAGLAFDQAKAGQPYAVPSRSASSDCALSEPSASGHCPGATIRTTGYAIQNSWAQVNRSKKRVSRPAVKEYPQYEIARKKLVQRKWQPVSNASADPCQKDDTRCEGKPEMQSCAGTAEANCIFLWQKNGRVREVNTINVPPVVVFSRSCPLRLNKNREIELCSRLSGK
jgi:hypothetical protein